MNTEEFVEVYDLITSPSFFDEGEAKRIYDIVVEYSDRDYKRRVLTLFYLKIINMKQYEFLMTHPYEINKLITTNFPFFYQKVTDRNSKVESTSEYWATGFDKKTLHYITEKRQ